MRLSRPGPAWRLHVHRIRGGVLPVWVVDVETEGEPSFRWSDHSTHQEALQAALDLIRACQPRGRASGPHGRRWRPWRRGHAAGRRSIGGGCVREE